MEKENKSINHHFSNGSYICYTGSDIWLEEGGGALSTKPSA